MYSKHGGIGFENLIKWDKGVGINNIEKYDYASTQFDLPLGFTDTLDFEPVCVGLS